MAKKKENKVKKPIVVASATDPTPTCKEGEVWDDVLKKCVLDLG